MVVEELELTKVDEGVEACNLTYLLVVEDYLLDLPLPRALRVNYYTRSSSLVFSQLTVL